MNGEKVRNLYKLLEGIVLGEAAAAATDIEPRNDNTDLWHMRLGHLSERGLNELHKKNLLKGVKGYKLEFCKFCVMGKQKMVSFSTSSHTSKVVIDYVHIDMWGPSLIASHGSSTYFVSFIDDYSRKVWVYFMKHKSEVFNVFRQWKAEVENQTGRKLKCIKSDNGTEYKENTFLEYCKNEGVARHFTVKKTPQQNGVAERMNRTLLERARCMKLNGRRDGIAQEESNLGIGGIAQGKEGY